MATLVVECPALATITLDGRATTSTGAQRTFATTGSGFYRVRCSLGGWTQTRRVWIRVGRTVRVKFRAPTLPEPVPVGFQTVPTFVPVSFGGGGFSGGGGGGC